MTDIDIICVEDGSTDGSRDILDRYAGEDHRISVFSRPGRSSRGVSAARNEGLARSRGKYVWFVDADDWLEPDACEKLFGKAEASQADMTLCFYRREGCVEKRPAWRKIAGGDKIAIDDRRVLFNFPAAWNRLWRADFLGNHQIAFPEGIASAEDHFVHWRGIAHAERIAVVAEQLYHYRYHPQSVSVSGHRKWMDIVPAYDAILRALRESGHYAAYREEFLSRKLRLWRNTWLALPEALRPEFVEKVRASLTEDDRAFLARPGGRMKHSTKCFYRMALGGDAGGFWHRILGSLKKW